MTNTLTYSTTSFGSAASGLLGLNLAEIPHYTPRFLSDRTTRMLDNLACSLQQAHDTVADHGAMFVVGIVVTGLFSMAAVIGISISV